MTHATFATQSTSIQRSLPCFPGYAMGGIILTSELELPYLQQEIATIQDQLEEREAKIQALQIKIEQNPSEKTTLRAESNNFDIEIGHLTSIKNSRQEEIEALQKDKGSYRVKPNLPIDYHRSGIDYRHQSNESEKMHFIIVQRQSAEEQIKNFSNHLTRMQYLPTVVDLIQQVSTTIISQTQQSDQEVCLIGSFITLSHVRVMDPIILRQEAVLDSNLLNRATAKKYSVIAESVLGGVFIGFGNRASTFSETDPSSSSDARAIASRIHTFSFVSQGAIPATDNFNLWETYNSWKKRLTSETHSGFPIAFKVRQLTDILEENGYKLQETDILEKNRFNPQD